MKTSEGVNESHSVRVLDHGYVRLIESWGSDARIIEAARMSTNKGFQGWGPKHAKDCAIDLTVGVECTCGGGAPGDEKLLSYLYYNKHSTPFEMAGMTIEVKAPIFVFREWHRHRTQSYNELSARYTPLPDENYLPALDRCLARSDKNKQASAVSGTEADSTHVACWLKEVSQLYEQIETVYQNGLRVGIAKELARIVLPVGRYSRMRASANLRNWLAFLTLRTADGAQLEIRHYAHAVERLVGELFPRTYKLFVEEPLSP